MKNLLLILAVVALIILAIFVSNHLRGQKEERTIDPPDIPAQQKPQIDWGIIEGKG